MAPENLQYHTFLDYTNVCISPGIIVPQEVYPAPMGFDQLNNIPFIVNGCLGIPLSRAIIQDFRGLENMNATPILSAGGMRVAVRIKWPGYDQWSDNVHVFSHAAQAQPCTLAKLAHLVARTVRKFIDDMSTVPSREASADWWISQVPLEDLVLLELRHVSRGSWQPVLCRIIHH